MKGLTMVVNSESLGKTPDRTGGIKRGEIHWVHRFRRWFSPAVTWPCGLWWVNAPQCRRMLTSKWQGAAGDSIRGQTQCTPQGHVLNQLLPLTRSSSQSPPPANRATMEQALSTWLLSVFNIHRDTWPPCLRITRIPLLQTSFRKLLSKTWHHDTVVCKSVQKSPGGGRGYILRTL